MGDARQLLCLVICMSLGLISIPVRAATECTRIRTDPTGVYQLDERSNDESGRPSEGLANDATLGGALGALLWHRSQTNALYTTAAILASQSSVAAATSLNPPKRVEYIPLEGQGTPTWVAPGSDLYVSASRDGQVIAAVEWLTGAATATVYKWHVGSSTPDWSYQYPCANPGVYRTVAVSADGSTIAVIGRTDAWRTYLHYFSADLGTPLGTYWSTSASCYPRTVALTAHGDYMALVDGSDVIVVGRNSGTERWHGTGGGSDAMAISEDGNYLAYGWATLRMYHWNGSIFQSMWSAAGGAYYLNRCAFSADGSTFAAGWYHYPAYDQNRIQLWDMPSSTPRWTYLYVQSAGSYNDLPSDIAITQDGSYVAVASWGNEFNVNPELEVFAHATPTPVFTLDTPGSMFETDIVGGANGAYVITCGKHVHANNFGSGGDLYSIRLGNPASVEEPAVAGRSEIRIYPQPFVAGGTIRLIGATAPAALAILDAQGSLIRMLSCDAPSGGAAAVRWDGLDARGQAVPAGVYFCRVVGGVSRVSAKLVMSR